MGHISAIALNSPDFSDCCSAVEPAAEFHPVSPASFACNIAAAVLTGPNCADCWSSRVESEHSKDSIHPADPGRSFLSSVAAVG